MVERNPEPLNRVFRALADPTRREILRRLTQGPLTVTELAAPHRMSLAAVSKHLQALEKAGLLRRRIRGREHYCRLEPKTLSPALEWLRFYEKFWNERLDVLDRILG